jgi:hypothetical protein
MYLTQGDDGTQSRYQVTDTAPELNPKETPYMGTVLWPVPKTLEGMLAVQLQEIAKCCRRALWLSYRASGILRRILGSRARKSIAGLRARLAFLRRPGSVGSYPEVDAKPEGVSNGEKVDGNRAIVDALESCQEAAQFASGGDTQQACSEKLAEKPDGQQLEEGQSCP